jgi:phosphoribosylformylglycinamidine synthase
MPTNLYVSAPLRGKTRGVITTVAFNPFYGDVDPAAMARLMMFEAVTKAVVAGADYRELALCDNFYTPKLRPDVAWDLREMVRVICELSLELGIPFISGKDSSSGTMESAGRRIDVPPTLVVSAFGRVADTKRIVTKEFKQAGNRLVIVGKTSPRALGGSVYADSHGQRGDALFDAHSGAEMKSIWEALHRAHADGAYCSASAIAEGGVMLRLFEAAYGSGLGAGVELAGEDIAGLLFGEFTGSVLLEVPASVDLRKYIGNLPHLLLGEVTSAPKLELASEGETIWEYSVSSLAEAWSSTFQEVVK